VNISMLAKSTRIAESIMYIRPLTLSRFNIRAPPTEDDIVSWAKRQ
jgi:hypothetical protein